jgi:hypothetical protein
MRGFEPPQDCSYSVLSAARLPFRHIRMMGDCHSIEAKIVYRASANRVNLILDFGLAERSIT